MFKRIPWKTLWKNRLAAAELADVVVIGMGTNIGSLGQRRHILLKAIYQIEAADVGRVLAVSSLYETPPWGNVEQEFFTNGVFAMQTALEPMALLKRLKSLERRLGRKPRERWGPREIDLDILIYRNRAVTAPGLIIPHKHMAEREFVMVPLRELVGYSKQPLTRRK